MTGNRTDVIELLDQYHKNAVTQRLRDKFLTPSLFDIIQKDRSETVHSNFLKWLFDLQVTNSIEGFNIVSSLLRVAYKRATQQGLQNEFPTSLAKAAYGDHSSVQVVGKAIREYKCAGVIYTGNGKNKSGQEGIADLVINGFSITYNADGSSERKPFKIIIENKVDSEEHNKQTWKYYAFFEGKTEGESEIEIQKIHYDSPVNEDRIYLYLTPTPASNFNTVKCSCPHFIKINYQDIMEHCIAPLLQSSRLDSRNRMFLEEYSRALSLPYINNIGKNIIMSLNPTDAVLLKEFWDANQELISLSLEALKQTLNNDKENEEKKAIEDTLNAINALQGKRIKYKITHNGSGDTVQTNQTNLMYDLVKMYIKHTGKSWADFENDYSDISSIFCHDKAITGYKWDKDLSIGITTQKQRNAKVVKKIKAHAAKDGFTVE